MKIMLIPLHNKNLKDMNANVQLVQNIYIR